MRSYYRLSGGGNDFLALVGPSEDPAADEIRSVCSRGLSAGADGLFVLERTAAGARMRYFNADGRAAELCLNGTRCAVRLAHHLQWATESLTIETGAGPIVGRAVGTSEVALHLPRPEPPRVHDLGENGRELPGWFVTVGVPHFVLPWFETLTQAPVSELGAVLCHHREWGHKGSNIDFVRFIDPHRFEIRTYERGVEAETLACGTGVMAATAVGLAQGELDLPVRALTLGGFELEVDAVSEDNGEDQWSLAGDARLIAEGTLHPGAFDLPPEPQWS